MLTIGIVAISFIGFIGYGLYRMEIEDHYGELQELFHSSKNGDVIINKTTSEFGLIEKNWKRINIKTKEKDSTDLYNWVNRNGTTSNVELYRPQGIEINLNKLEYQDVKEMIIRLELKGVSEY